MKGYLIMFVSVAVIIALVFRVPQIRSIVVGA